jgi:centromere protein C
LAGDHKGCILIDTIMSSHRKSDSFLHPGKVGRKTGFQVTWTPRRGANGLEDPKDFFLSDDEFESSDLTSKTSPQKRLSLRYSRIQELEQKPTPAIKQLQTLALETDKKIENTKSALPSAFERSPPKPEGRTLTSLTGSPAINRAGVAVSETEAPMASTGNTTNGTRLTKNIALNKSSKSSKFQAQNITNASPDVTVDSSTSIIIAAQELNLQNSSKSPVSSPLRPKHLENVSKTTPEEIPEIFTDSELEGIDEEEEDERREEERSEHNADLVTTTVGNNGVDTHDNEQSADMLRLEPLGKEQEQEPESEKEQEQTVTEVQVVQKQAIIESVSVVDSPAAGEIVSEKSTQALAAESLVTVRENRQESGAIEQQPATKIAEIDVEADIEVENEAEVEGHRPEDELLKGRQLERKQVNEKEKEKENDNENDNERESEQGESHETFQTAPSPHKHSPSLKASSPVKKSVSMQQTPVKPLNTPTTTPLRNVPSSQTKRRTPKQKAITTMDIAERVLPKEALIKSSALDERKIRTPRRAAPSQYVASQLLTSGSEDDDSSSRLSDDSDTSDDSDGNGSESDVQIQNSKPKQPVEKMTPVREKGNRASHPARQPEKQTIMSKMIVAKPLPKPPQKKQEKKMPVSPIRRSTRTRVPPLATWRNEKIVYKTEKINGAIVKSVNTVLHTPEDEEETSERSYSQVTKTSQGRSKRVERIDLSESAKSGKSKVKPTVAVKTKAARPSKLAESAKPAKRVKPAEVTSKRPLRAANASSKRPAKVTEVPIKRPTRTIERTALKQVEDLAKKVSTKRTTRSERYASEPTKKRQAPVTTLRKPSKRQKTQSLEGKDHAHSRNVDEELESDAEVESDDALNPQPKTKWQKSKEKSLTLSVFEGPGTEKQVERTVAFAPDSYKNVTIIKNTDEYFKVGTLFDQDSEFCGGGVIELPSGSKKAVKSNHDTYFIFYVISGQVEVTLSRNTFVVTKGCSFEIPMGNYYQFINTGSSLAKMMFVQSKYIVIGDADSESGDSESDGEEGSSEV